MPTAQNIEIPALCRATLLLQTGHIHDANASPLIPRLLLCLSSATESRVAPPIQPGEVESEADEAEESDSDEEIGSDISLPLSDTGGSEGFSARKTNSKPASKPAASGQAQSERSV